MSLSMDNDIYQHPLAYIIGLEGLALLRAFSGEYDREFTLARLAEIRTLLDAAEIGSGGAAHPVPSSDAYDTWAPWYDKPNTLIDLEEPYVREILDGLPVGVALDAACGTGRHAAYLAERGHTVIGVDSSPGMIAVARTKIPGGEFHVGDLRALPLADQSVDVVVCALALVHVPDLAPVMAEFARVLRPGGHLVISDGRGMPAVVRHPMLSWPTEGQPGYMFAKAHLTSEYLAAVLPLGFAVRRCEEPRRPSPYVDPAGLPHQDNGDPSLSEPNDDGHPPDIWSLHRWCPEATNAAYRDEPALIVWHFQLNL